MPKYLRKSTNFKIGAKKILILVYSMGSFLLLLLL
jgi:hypothetical protein